MPFAHVINQPSVQENDGESALPNQLGKDIPFQLLFLRAEAVAAGNLGQGFGV
jgi:hypothetical protein